MSRGGGKRERATCGGEEKIEKGLHRCGVGEEGDTHGEERVLIFFIKNCHVG